MAGRVKVFLSHFWRPDDPAEVEEALIRDWVEILKGFRTDEVSAAMRESLAHPECTASGRPVRPGPWVVVKLIERERAVAWAKAKMESKSDADSREERPRCTAEQASKIMDEVGYCPLSAHPGTEA